MARHAITLPDMLHGDEPRTVIWDDVAGTVEGTHSNVSRIMQPFLARPTPVRFQFDNVEVILKAPGHDPADFLWLLWMGYQAIMREPLRSTLPPVFDGIEPTPIIPSPRARRDANGNPTPYYEDGSLIGIGAPWR